MTNSRDKGKRGERRVAQILRDHGYTDARRTQQYCGDDGDSDVAGMDGFSVEVKYRERGHGELYEWLDQSQRSAQEGEIPIVVHFKNRAEELVTLKFSDLLRLIQR